MSGNEIIDKNELRSLTEIFSKSNGVFFAHGFEKRRKNIFRTKIFEKKFSEFLKVKYSVTCSSGTAAGSMCLKALGIKPGDEVIVPSFTFIAAIECIIAVGAVPIIVDSDESYNMCPKLVEKKINKKTKALMLVHMLGVPCDIQSFLKIKKKYKIKIIEDSCEALGAKYKNNYIGTLGDVGFFSFDYAKLITTGEGGMCVTNDKKIAKLLQALRDHGHENKPKLHRGLDKAIITGFNYRMTELQAAIGIEQLKKAKKILKLKKRNFKILASLIKRDFKNINFRKNFKNSEQIFDFMVIKFDNFKTAKKITLTLNKNNFSTGILPIANRWHYAGYWSHIFKENKIYRNHKLDKWKNNWDQINRSISIPISILDRQRDIKNKYKVLKKTLSENKIQ